MEHRVLPPCCFILKYDILRPTVPWITRGVVSRARAAIASHCSALLRPHLEYCKQAQERCGDIGAGSEESSEDGQRAGAALLWRKALGTVLLPPTNALLWLSASRKDARLRGRSQGRTSVDVLIQMAVLLRVRPDPTVVLIDEDAHLGQQLHLLLVQVLRAHLGHRDGHAGSAEGSEEDESDAGLRDSVSPGRRTPLAPGSTGRAVPRRPPRTAPARSPSPPHLTAGSERRRAAGGGASR